MSDVVPTGRARAPAQGRRMTPSCRRVALLAAVPALVLLTTLSACTSKSIGSNDKSPIASGSQGAPDGSQTSTAPVTTAPVLPKAVITATPAAGTSVSPVQPVTVAVTDGKLTSVKLLNPEGKAVTGALAADGTSWKSIEELGYSKTYSLSAVAVDADGKPTTKKTHFTTLTPANMTMPYLNTTGGQTLVNGETYGVGIVPVVHFDEAVTDKKAAEKALVVRTSPHVSGIWNWVSDTDAHWRPRGFYQPGTHVIVSANVYGVRVGPGLYGQEDQSVSFKIGAKHLSIANDLTHTVKVYFSGKLVRSMPTSMGRGGFVQGKNGQIPLWTMPGTYTVIAHENPAVMSSDSYGLPASSPAGYAPEKVYWATKISTDGIYLHELDATVWAQGNTDVSHGCLNMNLDNAKWYYQHALVGDVVQVVHTGGVKVQIYQNGDWTAPWPTWVAGSALH